MNGAVTKRDHYRGWEIHRSRWPEPEWSATAPDYDVDYNDEDGFVATGGHVNAPTYDALIAEIDDHFADDDRLIDMLIPAYMIAVTVVACVAVWWLQ